MSCRTNLVPLIVAAAARQGVPADVALSVAEYESGKCHWMADGAVKRGRDGEVGLMQVMPSTGQGYNLYDVKENIAAGVGYLRAMYDRFGSWPLAVAAYNWGPRYVQDAIRGARRFPASVMQYVAFVFGPGALSPVMTAGVSPSQSSPVTSVPGSEPRSNSFGIAKVLFGVTVAAAGMFFLFDG